MDNLNPINLARIFVRKIRVLRNPDTKFFKMSYEDRVAVIKETYSHNRVIKGFQDYLERDFNIIDCPEYIFDIIIGYVETLSPKIIQQIGCFSCRESKILIDSSFSGTIVASDYNKERIESLKSIFKETKYEKIKLKQQDLENPHLSDFKNIDMIFCNAVLSNIQPERLEELFKLAKNSGVKLFLIGDVYSKDSLSIKNDTSSHRLAAGKNWFHPFLALGRRAGYEARFLPDRSDDAYLVSRGIFILSYGIDLDLHGIAIGKAAQRYFIRQSEAVE